MATLPIVEVRVQDIINKSLKSFEQNFGSVRVYRVRKYLLDIMKQDLIQILTDVVEVSLAYFNDNKKSHYSSGKTGEMANSLRRGIQVKGQAGKTLTAILHGVSYTIRNEENVKYKARDSQYIAIPLTKEFRGSACHADGTPIFSRPEIWKNHFNTFTITGDDAINKYGRVPTASGINPHNTDEVKYIVYRDKETGGIRWLYKLVPYSWFGDGAANVEGRQLRKLHLRARTEAAIASAAVGWANLIWSLLDSIPDFTDLKAYEDIRFEDVVVMYENIKTYKKSAIPTGKLETTVSDVRSFANWAAEVITI